MTSMGIQARLVIVLLLFLATKKAETAEGKGGVEFWRKDFKMICPKSGIWFYKDQKINPTEATPNHTLDIQYGNDKKGLYYCEYTVEDGEDELKNKYYFFVQGKVCENCFELDPTLFGVVIVMDVILTAVVMVIIFMCIKKKNPAGPAHPPKTPARPGGRGPPVPSPDYEQLNAHTRSQDTYSIVNRTG